VFVREISEFGGCVAAERLGRPHAAVQVSAFRPRLHGVIAPRLNRARDAVGLSADPDVAMLYRHLLLTPVPANYEDPEAPFPPTACAFQRVSFDRRDDERLPSWFDSRSSHPMVYATLGTAYNRFPDIFSAILTALSAEAMTLIVTIGDSLNPSDFGEQPPHVHVERYIPHSLLFPHCDLVITHGGFGTVMDALSAGLPMVMIPIAADQPDNAQRCAELGLAQVIEPGCRTPAAINEATRQVMEDSRYRQHAERLRDEMRTQLEPGRVVELLELLAAGASTV
jgi:UDP:flavonoid glycosyltransferase YjiC (YdhE family)